MRDPLTLAVAQPYSRLHDVATNVEHHVELVPYRGNRGADMDLYVAGVCETEVDSHVQTEQAASIIDSHQVWVAVASFAMPTGGGFDSTAGRSTIWRPDRTTAAGLDRHPGHVASATITEP